MLDGWPNTGVVRGDLVAEISKLKRESPVPLRTIGGMALVSSMMKVGLVDMLRVTIFPVTLGPDGREPIYASSRVLDSRLVMLEYRPASGAGAQLTAW